MLDLHRDLGRQEELVAIDRRGELHAFLGNLAQRPQREDLEAARVGQDRFVPAHKAVEAAELFEDFHARAQPQMESVAQTDLRADIQQLVRAHRLDRAVSAHRHEDRGFDDAVRQMHTPPARLAGGGEKFEFHDQAFCRNIASP